MTIELTFLFKCKYSRCSCIFQNVSYQKKIIINNSKQNHLGDHIITLVKVKGGETLTIV
jgi:hypothetical protein